MVKKTFWIVLLINIFCDANERFLKETGYDIPTVVDQTHLVQKIPFKKLTICLAICQRFDSCEYVKIKIFFADPTLV